VLVVLRALLHDHCGLLLGPRLQPGGLHVSARGMQQLLPALLAALVLMPGAAGAQDWAQSFSPAAAGSYLEAGNQKVLVAAAGEPLDAVRSAASALETALRASGRAQLVMGSAGLGSLAQDSDTQVVQKARPFPVDTVAVVRVFAGAPGAPSTAVVTFYDTAGKVLSALSVVSGTPLGAREGSGTTQAVPSSALQAVQEVGKSAEDAQAQYDKQHVWFEDGAFVGVQSGRVMARFTDAFQGKNRTPLEGARFYEVVGRQDLADDYRSRKTKHLVLLWGGMAGLLGGGAVMATGISSSCQREVARTGECLQKGPSPVVPGAILAGAGTVAMLASLPYMEFHPVKPPARRDLAEEYNKKLKGELGLARAAPPAPAPTIRVASGFVPGGAGLTLELRL
jgi:hypothetical protein